MFKHQACIHGPDGINLDTVRPLPCLPACAGACRQSALHDVMWGVAVRAALQDVFFHLQPLTPARRCAQVMKGVLALARQHEVSIDSSYAALVVGVCVIVGFATNLDPALNLMDAAAPALFMHNLTGRIIGQLYA